MKLGFIGTGQITKAVIYGILNSKIKYSKIYVSSRNKKISSHLSKISKKIIIIKDNEIKTIFKKSNALLTSKQVNYFLGCIRDNMYLRNFHKATLDRNELSS